MMLSNQLGSQTFPLPIVGGSSFGRYPQISSEETYNMTISDEALVPMPGYSKIVSIGGQGRGLYGSTQYNHLIAVIDDGVYSISTDNAVSHLFDLQTDTGDVYISENDGGQIAISDGLAIYVFDYFTNESKPVSGVNFLPNYLDFQDGYFISCGISTSSNGNPIYNQWYLSDPNNGTQWNTDVAAQVGLLQSKPDVCVATVNFNKQLFVFGKNVTEIWVDVGYTLFPYQRNNYINIDYGCLNPATIAKGSIQYGQNQDLVPLLCWLGGNEKSGPTIMYSTGGTPSQLSTDGINFKIEQLTQPSNCYAFMYRVAGHTIYQIVWPIDNVSFAYDFNIGKFITVTDEFYNCHIAKRVAFFNNTYYFLSLNDGSLYEMSSDIYTYNDAEIPRVRILPPFRLPNSSRFVVNNTTLTMQQGQFQEDAAILLSISTDGGLSYSNVLREEMQNYTQRPNQVVFWNLGSANDIRLKYQFWGFDKFVITGGEIGVYQ